MWNDPAKIESATKAMKITPDELKKAKLIDDIIPEPLSGAHRDRESAAQAIKTYFLTSLSEILKDKDYLQKRYEKIMHYGAFSE